MEIDIIFIIEFLNVAKDDIGSSREKEKTRIVDEWQNNTICTMIRVQYLNTYTYAYIHKWLLQNYMLR